MCYEIFFFRRDYNIQIMNEEELKQLSLSVSYWDNSQLEHEAKRVLPDVLSSFDNQSLVSIALSIVQDIKKRFTRNRVCVLCVLSM